MIPNCYAHIGVFILKFEKHSTTHNTFTHTDCLRSIHRQESVFSRVLSIKFLPASSPNNICIHETTDFGFNFFLYLARVSPLPMTALFWNSPSEWHSSHPKWSSHRKPQFPGFFMHYRFDLVMLLQRVRRAGLFYLPCIFALQSRISSFSDVGLLSGAQPLTLSPSYHLHATRSSPPIFFFI